MIKNILVPTDFSVYAWNALQYTQKLFRNTACNFYLLHVHNYINHPVSARYGEKRAIEDASIGSKKELNSILRLAEESSCGKKHTHHAIHEQGFFLDTIKRNISEKKIDLIVMGTKGATGIRKHILGSNTGEVITKIHANALIVPKHAKFSCPKEIAFPTDFNIFYSHNILEAISEMLRLGKGNIRVMNVKKTNGRMTNTQERNKAYLFDYLNETFAEKNSFHSVTNTDVNAAIQCFVESRNIEMIIMVAKNLNFVQQILFDSIVEKISFHTTIPFFVLHE